TSITWSAGLRQTQNDPLPGHTTTYDWDAARRRLTDTVDATGARTTYAYDAAGNQTSVQDPLAHTSSATYDGLRRALTRTDATGATTTVSYDGIGDLS